MPAVHAAQKSLAAHQLLSMAKTISKARWDKLMQRMIAYGINDVPLKAIPDNLTEIVRDPREAAARLLLLLSVSFCASNSAESDKIADWLKIEDIWQLASENEKSFLREPDITETEKAKLSFRFEGAYMLAWALGLVPLFPDPSSECDPELVADFFATVPPPGSPTEDFFEDAAFNRVTTIHDEYLFYNIVKLYFKHIRETDKENSSNVHEAAGAERLLVLEWLFNPELPEWDELGIDEEEEY
jgi:hypothetical protein